MRKNVPALQGLIIFSSENLQLTLHLLVLGIVLSACLPAAYPGADSRPPVIEPSHIAHEKIITCSDIENFPDTGTEIIITDKTDIPAARDPFSEPMFHSCLVRITDNQKDFRVEDSDEGIKNEYSRVQSFNSDESLLLLRGTDGSWFLYDSLSLEPLQEIPLVIDPRWDSQNPNKIYYFENASLYGFNITDKTKTLVHDFSNDFPGSKVSMVWTRYEGSPSMDGRYWGLMAENEEWLTDYLLVYDQLSNEIIAQKDLRSYPDSVREIDSVTISPLGNYFLVYHDAFCDPGILGTEEHPCGLMVYDRNLQTGRGLIRIIGHSDLALDENGKEILVFQDIDTDTISSLNLATGKISTILPIDFSKTSIGFHFSGRAYEKPGWVVVSTYSSNNLPVNWMENQVFILETKPGGRIIRLAPTRSVVRKDKEHDYWAEPQASTNRTLTQVIFGSNWEKSGTTQINTFLVQVPESWLAVR